MAIQEGAQQYEIALVLHEIEWRLRELGRELLARSSVLPNAEQTLARVLSAPSRPR